MEEVEIKTPVNYKTEEAMMRLWGNVATANMHKWLVTNHEDLIDDALVEGDWSNVVRVAFYLEELAIKRVLDALKPRDFCLGSLIFQADISWKELADFYIQLARE